MKPANNIEWTPSKFIRRNGKWVASDNEEEVARGSRLRTDRVAAAYHNSLCQYAKGKLLDLGCGKAPLYGMYSEQCAESIRVDWKSSKHDNKFIDVFHDISQRLPFSDDEFDTVVFTDVLEHLYNPVEVVAEIKRVLKDQGTAIIGVPFYQNLHEDPYDFFRYTKYALKRLIEDAGLDIVCIDEVGGLPEVMFDLFEKATRRSRLISRTVYHVGKHISELKVVETYSKRSAGKFPMGYLVIARK